MMRKRHFVGKRAGLIVVGMELLLLGACELTGGSSAELDYGAIREVRYTQHVQPLLGNKCTACHAGPSAAAGLQLDSWNHVTAGSDFGEAVIPFDADRSLLVEMATKLDPPHPVDNGGAALTQEEVAFLARWIDEGARDDEGVVPYEDADTLLYVANQDAAVVSVIDLAHNLVIRTVDLQDYGFSANARPHHTAVEPDGSSWYVSLIGESKVLKLDRQNRLVGQVDFETPGMLAVHPTEDVLYVGRSMTAVNPPSRVGLVRRSDLGLEEVDVFFPRPHALAVDPAGAYVYTASLSENELMVLNTETKEVSFTAVEGPPQAFVQAALAPDGQVMYVTAELSGQVHVFDLGAAPRLALLRSIGVGARPWHPVFTPDGRYVYVGNKGTNTITVIDAAARAVTRVVEGAGLAEPHGSAVRPDGRYVYVSNNNTSGAYVPRYDLGDNAHAGTVIVIDTATNAIVKVLEIEANPTGMSTRAES